MSGEGGFVGDRVSGWISVLSEHPFRDNTPADWTTQEIIPSIAVSSTLDVRVSGSPERATHMDLSLLRQWGGNAGDQGSLAQGGSASAFEARYPFQSALALGLRSSALARITASTRLISDVGHEGTIWCMELRYLPRDRWMLGVGADLLTSAAPEDPMNADFIGRFRANDRFHAGVTYVF
jgi:hypothetical protein